MGRNIKEKQENLTFGQVLAFVAGRECRNYPDRFLAILGFLRFRKYRESTIDIPLDPT
jgi:hypothetical protein